LYGKLQDTVSNRNKRVFSDTTNTEKNKVFSVYCIVRYNNDGTPPSVCIKVHERDDAQFLRRNLSTVFMGNKNMKYDDGLQKTLKLQQYDTTLLLKNVTVRDQWFILPLLYDVR